MFVIAVQALQEQREEEVQEQRQEEVGQQDPGPEVPIWKQEQEAWWKVRLPFYKTKHLKTWLTALVTNSTLWYLLYRPRSKEKDNIDPLSDKKKIKEEKEDEKIEDVSFIHFVNILNVTTL